MGLRETIKRILREETELPLSVRRRTSIINKVIDNMLPNMYPCDYNSADHFIVGILDEIIWFLPDFEDLQGIERIHIENYILNYKYDELTDYFNERCIVLEKMNLQESIRRILREELASREVESIESNDELDEYSRTLRNARKQGTKLRFPKSTIESNPLRFRPYSREKVEEADPNVEIEKDEQTEGELTEKCWKGYTKKGMKTMFGKRYPNCVKKKK
jgi:hypothetical protein